MGIGGDMLGPTANVINGECDQDDKSFTRVVLVIYTLYIIIPPDVLDRRCVCECSGTERRSH